MLLIYMVIHCATNTLCIYSSPSYFRFFVYSLQFFILFISKWICLYGICIYFNVQIMFMVDFFIFPCFQKQGYIKRIYRYSSMMCRSCSWYTCYIVHVQPQAKASLTNKTYTSLNKHLYILLDSFFLKFGFIIFNIQKIIWLGFSYIVYLYFFMYKYY